MFLYSRAANSGDVEIMLDLFLPLSRFGAERRELERARWDRLWGKAQVQGVVVENLSSGGATESVGMVVIAYFPPGLYDALMATDTPLIDGLADAVQNRETLWPDEKAIGEANAGEGLDLLTTWTGYADDGLSITDSASLRSRVVAAFSDLCAGHRIQRYTIESDDEAVVRRFEGYGLQTRRLRDGARVLCLERGRALAGTNLSMMRFFSYDPPMLGYSPGQRAVLLLARLGYTDQEIAATLGKSPDSVKKRWSSIYARFATTFPGRLPAAGTSARGQEKRRTLLSYLKDRPEELRPYGAVGG